MIMALRLTATVIKPIEVNHSPKGDNQRAEEKDILF